VKTTFAREFLPRKWATPDSNKADRLAAALSPFDPDRAAFRAGRRMLAEIRRRAEEDIAAARTRRIDRGTPNDHENPVSHTGFSWYSAGMIVRVRDVAAVRSLLRDSPVVGILGARQVGKSTLARQVVGPDGPRVAWFDLENARDLARLDDPLGTLERQRGLVVLDEVQLLPNLFPVLRVLADRPKRPARFLILGSASPALLRQGSESLAGRIRYFPLGGFSLGDAGADRLDRLWLRGGFPRSFLAPSDRRSLDWRNGFAETFLQRDLPQLGIRVPAATMRRFWTMLAHCHGQTWNASTFAQNFGVADTTARAWLDPCPPNTRLKPGRDVRCCEDWVWGEAA
jgi:hypothetical protein